MTASSRPAADSRTSRPRFFWGMLAVASLLGAVAIALLETALHATQPTLSNLLICGPCAALLLLLSSGAAALRLNFGLQRPVQLLIAALLLAGSLWLGWRVALLQGFIAPVRIDGPSMAPSFHGYEWRVACRDCRYTFAFDATNPATQLDRVVCPNCGARLNLQKDDLTASSAERVLIDRAAYLFRAPRRFDVVATRSPDGLAIKRVVGLPGEQIEIRRGELFINGQQLRKSLSEFHLLAQLVHDNAYKPTLAGRLFDRWQITTGSFANTLTAEYLSWRCFDSPLPRTEQAPITDHDPYNQGLSREVNEVRDLMLAAGFTINGSGCLFLHYGSGNDRCSAKIDFEQDQIELRRGSQTLARRRWNAASMPRGFAEWEFGSIDGRMVLAVNGKVFLQTIDQRDWQWRPGARPFAIESDAGLQVQVHDLRIARDIYYLGPQGLNVAWAGPQLAADQYFLVGDNVPVSRDSRQWGPINGDGFLGRVLTWK